MVVLPPEFANLGWKLNANSFSGEFLLLGTSGQVGEVATSFSLGILVLPAPVSEENEGRRGIYR